MASSSISDRIIVNNPKVIEEYVVAMEASAKALLPHKKERIVKFITDPSELKSIMLRSIGQRA